ncbi:hypothetical protein [Flavobacterium xanthum]|uniref:Uncharacterized protein n=1 Tax=Flavobacterium xanthum TaxID=69322 RepID=A0A1M6XAH9_9FLAO|nr:hypothetical protein [Flavobacterium xanthum]SHL02933.1 hypothetical protein SAMN05443669_1001187 [Flavobacterium xanthum]
MKKRILLQENENVANSVIAAHQRKENNSQRILTILKEIGLSLESFENWEREVEQHFRTQYPKASLDFCLDAAGIKEPYRQAESLYKEHYNDLSFEKLNDEGKEAIRESYRQYAETENQIEAYNLAHSIVKDLNQLQELGIRVNQQYAMNFCNVFHSTNSKVEVYENMLNDRILTLK